MNYSGKIGRSDELVNVVDDVSSESPSLERNKCEVLWPGMPAKHRKLTVLSLAINYYRCSK